MLFSYSKKINTTIRYVIPMGLIYKLSLNPWPSTNHSYIPGNIQSYTLKSKVRYLTYSSSQIMLPPKKPR